MTKPVTQTNKVEILPFFIGFLIMASINYPGVQAIGIIGTIACMIIMVVRLFDNFDVKPLDDDEVVGCNFRKANRGDVLSRRMMGYDDQ